MRAAATYFGLVFATGFALGAIRVPFLVPRIGERAAELLEIPFMLLAIVLAARFVVRRFALPADAVTRIRVGVLALAMLLVAEILLAVVLQDRSLRDYVASRDPVSGSAYLASLVLFAAMPAIVGPCADARSRS